MQFYDATNKRAICQEIDRLCDSDDTAYPRLDKTARVNDAMEELVGMIVNSDGVWEWDDTNQTDMPNGTLTLVEGQELYTFASEYLKIKRMKVKDDDGKWQPLRQWDSQDIEETGITIENYYGTDSSGNPNKGLPIKYDIIGDSFRLYPAPTSTSVTLSAGLKVEFVRTAVLFTPVSTTAADTTQPGLPSSYHVLLAYMAAIPFCMTYKKDRLPLLQLKITQLTKDLIKFYSRRNPDRRDVMTMEDIVYR